MNTRLRWLLLAVGMLACTACSNSAQALIPPTTAPTPTIAAAPVAPTVLRNAATPSPQIVVQAAGPTATPGTAVAGTDSSFAYLFPAYLPNALTVAPKESRVARDNEIGTTAGGFYLVTLNGSQQKLVIGGGSTDALPISGDTRQVPYDGATALLTTSGEQRQLVFVRNKAKYFVYGRGISEQELLLVAESLVPMDITALRDMVASK